MKTLLTICLASTTTIDLAAEPQAKETVSVQPVTPPRPTKPVDPSFSSSWDDDPFLDNPYTESRIFNFEFK